jgi:hypothetical protein
MKLDPGGYIAQRPIKIEKITFLEVLDVLFSGLKASPVAWPCFMEA